LQEVGDAKGGAKRVAFSRPAEVVREDALPDQTDYAADQDAGADEERRSARARMRCFRLGSRRRNSGADLFDSFAGDVGGRFISGDFGVAGQRAYSFILFRSVL
jgi:hypothetical protein